MSKVHDRRKCRNASAASFSVVVQPLEGKLLLSAATVVALDPSTSGMESAFSTKDIDIVVETTFLGSSGDTFSLTIDEARIAGDEIRVFATKAILSRSDYYSASDPFVFTDTVTITVPDRELKVVRFLADIENPQNDLFLLRQSGTSTLIYRRSDADISSAWPVTDVSPGDGSAIELNYSPKPAAPSGLIAQPVPVEYASDWAKSMMLYFDEDPVTPLAGGGRYVRSYELQFQHGRIDPDRSSGTSSRSETIDRTMAAMDIAAFSVTSSAGMTRSFGGTNRILLPQDSYAYRVRVQHLAVFPEGAAGTNALASPWSDWSGWTAFSVLSPGTQIHVNSVYRADGEVIVSWGAVSEATSYEIWIEDLTNSRKVFRQTGITELQFSRETPFDPGAYQVWVRATRKDGSLTTWSRAMDFGVGQPYANLKSTASTFSYRTWTASTYDLTPTLTWNRVAWSTGYRISVIDLAKETEARNMQFPSEAVRQRFSIVYSAIRTGAESEHTISRTLPEGQYRVRLIQDFSNRTESYSELNLNLLSSGIPIVNDGNASITWTANPDAESYDVWVAYLGAHPWQTIISPQSRSWQFAVEEGVTTGSYQLSQTVPGGQYRVWLRPNVTVEGRLVKGNWKQSPVFRIEDPLFRATSVWFEDGRIQWDAIPGAREYEVVVAQRTNYNSPEYSDQRRFRVLNETSLTLPAEVDSGFLSIWVRAIDSSYPWQIPYSQPLRSVESPWSWNLRISDTALEWNPVPGATAYQVIIWKLQNGRYVEMLPESTLAPASNAVQLGFTTGEYSVSIRASQSVNGNAFWTTWERDNLSHFEYDRIPPDTPNINGTVLSWNAPESAEAYRVEVECLGGRLVTEYSSPRRIQTFYSTETAGDLAEWISAVLVDGQSMKLRIRVKALYPFPRSNSAHVESDWSESIVVTPELFPRTTSPLLDRAPQSAPQAPLLYGQRSISDFVPIHGPGSDVFRASNGTNADPEFVRTHQLRITDLRTHEVRVLDDSVVPELTAFVNAGESKQLGSGYYLLSENIRSLEAMGFLPGAYSVEARVKYLPVIVTDTPAVPPEMFLRDPNKPPLRISVAATPWSEWSDPLETIVQPASGTILAYTTSASMLDLRPVFKWVSSAPYNAYNAVSEIWVENHVTKELIVRESVYGWARQFRPAQDLPPGQYDWWVRMIGVEEARKGWSQKQSMEIFAPSITTNLVAETVDATPVVAWTQTPNAQSYRVTFTSVTTGRIAYQATATANQRTHRVSSELSNDTYNVSIQAVFPDGGRTAPGLINSDGSFAFVRMVIGAPPGRAAFSSSRVSWQAVEGATRYQVWINFTDSAGKIERVVFEDSFATELRLSVVHLSRPGQYRLWVRAIRNEAGHESVGRWSEPVALNVSAVSALHDSVGLATVMTELVTSRLLDAAA